MSVEKVNKYKEEKANRKEILEQQKKKAKQMKALVIAGCVVVAVLIVGAIGITARNEYNAYLAAQPNYDVDSMVLGDMAGVLEEETEEMEETEEAAAEGETEAAA